MNLFVRRYDAEDRALKLKAQADHREADRLSASTTMTEALPTKGDVGRETAVAPKRPTLDELWGLA